MLDYLNDSTKRIYEYKEKTQKALLLKSLIDLYYEVENVGGHLHIVLDDGNYDCVEYCLNQAKKAGDITAIDIANKCLEFNENELEIIVERSWGIVDHFELNK